MIGMNNIFKKFLYSFLGYSLLRRLPLEMTKI